MVVAGDQEKGEEEGGKIYIFVLEVEEAEKVED